MTDRDIDKKTVAVDAGGGGDKTVAGARPVTIVGPNGLADKVPLLRIALQIEDILETRGIRVAMTRKSDRNLSKAKRAQVARDAKASQFVSLGFAGSQDASSQGVGAIIHTDAGPRSERLALDLQKAVAGVLGHAELGVRRASRAVLRPDRLPQDIAACELQISHLTDPAEAERMTDDGHLARVAAAIAETMWRHEVGDAPPTQDTAPPEADAAPEAAAPSPTPDPPDQGGPDRQSRAAPEPDTDPTIAFIGKDLDMATIVIDPGHGGTTNLVCSSWNNAKGLALGTLEKVLTLDVALRVERELRSRGFSNVTLTRTTDVNVGGRERAQLARQLNADVLVSIHFNASNGHNAQGTETFIHTSVSKTGSAAHLCRSVQAAVLRATGLRDRNALHPPHFVKTGPWCVINPRDHAPGTAAILTEISFLDREDEERRLQRDAYRDEIAFALANGIESYLSEDMDGAVSAGAEDDFEDGIALAAAQAGITVEDLTGGAAPADLNAPAWRGGHHIATSQPARATSVGASVGEIARILSAPIQGAVLEEDERNEAAHLDGVEAPSFAGFGRDPQADGRTLTRLFGSNMAALTSFDHSAFADFVRGLNLRYFQPIELLYLGGQNERSGHRCEGKNALPPASLWQNIGPTIQMLDEIRHRIGGPVRILSGYRNDAYNDCIGGASKSLHKQFNAIDWTSTVGTVAQWHATARAVRASSPRYQGGIGDYPSQNFVHVDTRGYSVDF